jgi:hypothetical protein
LQIVLIAAFVALRRALGIELQPRSIRDSVDRLGVWGRDRVRRDRRAADSARACRRRSC